MASIPGAGPAFLGYIDTTVDAIRVVRAAVDGIVPRTSRRLSAPERRQLVRSGAVFVFSVIESGIKRWTDGVLWTPSRIRGNFLIYKQLEKRDDVETAFLRGVNNEGQEQNLEPKASSSGESGELGYKAGGLIKKTITISLKEMDFHLVSYYTEEDISLGLLDTPRKSQTFTSLPISPRDFKLDRLRSPPRIEESPDGRVFLIDENDTVSSEQGRPQTSNSSERSETIETPLHSQIKLVPLKLGLSTVPAETTPPRWTYFGDGDVRNSSRARTHDSSLNRMSLPPIGPYSPTSASGTRHRPLAPGDRSERRQSSSPTVSSSISLHNEHSLSWNTTSHGRFNQRSWSDAYQPHQTQAQQQMLYGSSPYDAVRWDHMSEGALMGPGVVGSVVEGVADVASSAMAMNSEIPYESRSAVYDANVDMESTRSWGQDSRNVVGWEGATVDDTRYQVRTPLSDIRGGFPSSADRRAPMQGHGLSQVSPSDFHHPFSYHRLADHDRSFRGDPEDIDRNYELGDGGGS